MKNKQLVNRMTLGGADGIYNQELFSLKAGDKPLIGLVGYNQYNPALNAIGFQTVDYDRMREYMLTYIGASGTANGTPSSAVLTEPCEPGQGVESGGVAFEHEGFTKLRRSSDVRDLTDIGIRYYDTQSIYTIAGKRIENDLVWDVARMGSVMVQDISRQVVIGDDTNPNETDGLINLISSTYTDPVTMQTHPEMASHVIDFNGNDMGTAPSSSGITYNGSTYGGFFDGRDIVDVINSYVRMNRDRLSLSTLSGEAKVIALLPSNAMQELMETYVFKRYSTNGVGSVGDYEKRLEIERMYEELGIYNSVTLPFLGQAITFFPYDFGLYDELNNRASILFLVPDVGSTPIIRIQTKDMSKVLTQSFSNNPLYRSSDMNRWLWWENRDETCYRVHLQHDMRVYMNARWLQMKITNIAINASPLSNISLDNQSPRYLGNSSLVRWS